MKTRILNTSAIRKRLAALLMAGSLFSGAALAQAECVSNQLHISDAWCKAVDCASVYVDGGYCLLLDDTVDEVIDEVEPMESEAEDAEVDVIDNEAEDEAVEPEENEAEDEAVEPEENEAEEETVPDPAPGGATDGQCVSNQPHISDAWCKASACHPVYIASGHCAVIDEEG
jgi:hypothetical protein